MDCLPRRAKRRQTSVLEARATFDHATDDGRKQRVAGRIVEALGHVRNRLIDPRRDHATAADVHADAHHHFHGPRRPHEFDQNASELAAVEQDVVRPLQLDAGYAAVAQGLAHRQAHYQAQRADLHRRARTREAKRERDVAPERAEPSAAATPTAGKLYLRREYATSDRFVRRPLHQGRVRAVDAGADVELAKPGRGAGREPGADGVGGEQLDVVVQPRHAVGHFDADGCEVLDIRVRQPGDGRAPAFGEFLHQRRNR